MVLPALWILLAVLVAVAFFHFRGRSRAVASTTAASEPLDRLLRSAFDSSPIGVGYLDSNGTWTVANKRLASLLGYSNLELLNVPMRMLTHADDRKREAPLYASLRSVKSNGYTIVKRMRRKSGDYRTFRVQMLRCGDDANASCQCTVEEVSHHATSPEQFVAALHAVEEAGVVHCDGSGTITSWTRGAERLFGRTEAEAVGRQWHTVQGLHHTEVAALLAAAAQSGKVERTVTRSRADGSSITVVSTIVPYSLMQSTGFIEICTEAGDAPPLSRLRSEHDALVSQLATLREQESSQETVIASLRAANAELARKLRVLASGIRKLMAEREAAGLSSHRLQTDPAVTPLAPPVGHPPETLDEAVRDLVEQHRSGTLSIKATGGEQRLMFEDGRLVAFSSNRKESFLGQLLVDGGVISEEQRLAALAEHQSSGQPFGSSVLRLGFATPADLATAIRSKAHRELAESVSWEDCAFTFIERDHADRAFAPVAIDVLDILAEIGGDGGSQVGTAPVASPGAPAALTARIPVRSNHGNGHYYVARALSRTSSARAPAFHKPDCTSARAIPQQSLVRFTTPEEATANRYIPCKRCLGQTESHAELLSPP